MGSTSQNCSFNNCENGVRTEALGEGEGVCEVLGPGSC